MKNKGKKEDGEVSFGGGDLQKESPRKKFSAQGEGRDQKNWKKSWPTSPNQGILPNLGREKKKLVVLEKRTSSGSSGWGRGTWGEKKNRTNPRMEDRPMSKKKARMQEEKRGRVSESPGKGDGEGGRYTKRESVNAEVKEK